MSKLEELIQQYCPDGVEWVPFFDVCDLIRGITYNKEQEAKAQSSDAHKVLRANNITLHLNVLNFDDVKLVSKDVIVKPAQHLFAGDILMCAGSGSKEHVGKVAFIPVDMDYTFGGFMAVVRCKKSILPRFVYHILTSGYFSNHLEVQINSSTINNINKQVMQSFELPVPPLPVQKEIVRILDAFTELQAELQAELQKRLQQYNYYRDNIFQFEGRTDVEWKKLGDIGKVCMCKRIMKDQTSSSGDVPFYKIGTFGGDADAFISKELFEEYKNKYSYPNKGDILISAAGTIGRTVVFDGKASYFQDSNIVWLKHNESVVLNSFLRYCYTQSPWAISTGGTIARLYNDNILNAVIPVPSISEQQRIVDILDRFDALTTDLSQGLPAEIEKRKLQYEYYRDRLLTFKRKEA